MSGTLLALLWPTWWSSSEEESTIKSSRSSCCEAECRLDWDDKVARCEPEGTECIGSFAGTPLSGGGTICLNLETVFRRRHLVAGIAAEAALGTISREEEEPEVMRLVVVVVGGGTVSECVREGTTLREDLESGGDRISSSSDSTTSLLFRASGRTGIAGRNGGHLRKTRRVVWRATSLMRVRPLASLGAVAE